LRQGLAMYPRLASKLSFSCFHLRSAEITGTDRYTQPITIS
jgi:hypothetical protein